MSTRDHVMLNGLAGKAAVVTGAAGGIGEAVTRRLLVEGASVVAVDLNVESLRPVAEQNGRLRVLEGDVTEALTASTAVGLCLESFGAVDLFLANAGVEARVVPVVDFDQTDYERVFRVNVLGSFLCAQAAVRQMLVQPSGGSVLFMASTGALKGTSGMSVYSASKHAVLGLSRSLAREVGEYGIRVNTLCPGPVNTPMMAAIMASRATMLGVPAEELRVSSEASFASGRYATPDEVAATAVWVLSEECAFMHDEVVTLGGGSL